MRGFDIKDFNPKMAFEKGYDYFKSNIKNLVAKDKIGEKREGKWVGPTDAEIRALYDTIIREYKKAQKIADSKPEATVVEPVKTDK